MRSVNKVTLLGTIGRDAETVQTTSSSVTKFSLATERRFKKGDEWVEETDWHNIVFWRADNVAQYLVKGARIYVEGRIQTRSYEKNGEKRYATDIIAENVILLDRPPASAGAKVEPITKPKARAAAASASQGPITDEDVPF